MEFINKQSSKIVFEKDYSKNIVFEKGRMLYLIKMQGKVNALLFLIIDDFLEYNNHFLYLDTEFYDVVQEKLNVCRANATHYLKSLCNNGILKKVRRGIYIYNPHIFYYADEKVAEEMRENFVCEFDEVNLKIMIDNIKTNTIIKKIIK